MTQDVQLPYTSQVEEQRNAPRHLIGYQQDLQPQNQQRQQQRVESKSLRAPMDLRDKSVALKRARDPMGGCGLLHQNTNSPHTQQPEARRGKFLGESLSQAEERLDITARNAARLQ